VELRDIRRARRPNKVLARHDGAVWSASFSPDGSRIVSGSSDKTVRIWDAVTGDAIRTLEGHTNSVWSASFSSDGSRIVSGSDDKTVRIWDAVTGDAIRTLEGHTNSVLSASFSPDGSRIVSGSDDKTVRIWDAQPHTHPLTLRPDVNRDGWLLDTSGKLGFWIPPEYREHYKCADDGCILVMPAKRVVLHTATSGLFHGTNWSQCWAESG
jgi:WD40 repeat protein